MASSLVELYFSYRETQRAIVRVERAKAVAAAARIEQFLKEIEQQVRETTRTASDDPDASQVGPGQPRLPRGAGRGDGRAARARFRPGAPQRPRHQRAQPPRPVRQGAAPRVAPGAGRRRQPGGFLPGARSSSEARAGKTYWSPVYLRNDSEPYVTLAVPVGKYAVEVTTAEVSLGAVLKIVSQIEVGPGGYAYVVDSRNQLVAHPDSRVLQAKRDLSALAQVKSARAERSSAAETPRMATVADGLGGGRGPRGARADRLRSAGSSSSSAPPRTRTRRSGRRSSGAPSSSCWASRSRSSRACSSPGAWSRRSACSRRARRGSAPGSWTSRSSCAPATRSRPSAGSFNRMTASLKESYEGLEQKVEARTRELADANRDLTEALEQQTATSEILRVIQQLADRHSAGLRYDRGERGATLRRESLVPCIGTTATRCTWSPITMSPVRRSESLRQLSPWLRRRIDRSEGDPYASGSSTSRRDDGFPEDAPHAAHACADSAATSSVPMMRDGKCLGVIVSSRGRPGLVPDSQVATAADLRRPGGDRDRERTSVQGAAGADAGADPVGRGAAGARRGGPGGQREPGPASPCSRASSRTRWRCPGPTRARSTSSTRRDQVFVPRANYGMSDALIEALRQSHIRIGEAGIGQAAAARAAFQIADLETRIDLPADLPARGGVPRAPRRSPAAG